MADAATSTNVKDQAASKSSALAQALPSDAVLDALKLILLGAPLNEVLTAITRLIEAHSTGMLCSIFLLDEDGLHLRYGVAASLPEAYRAATDGLCIGPNIGSCGSAAYLREPVFVSDIASDPRWVKFRDVALQSGLRAAWSTPIMSHDDRVLGTFCMYYREVRQPGPGEIQLIDYASRIAGIAVERDRSQTALTRAFEQIEKSEAQLRHIVDAIPQMIAVLNPDGTVLYMNQTMLDYTGLTIEDVMAKDVRDRAFNPEYSEANAWNRFRGVCHFKTKNEAKRRDRKQAMNLAFRVNFPNDVEADNRMTEILVERVNSDRDLLISTTSNDEKIYARIAIMSARTTGAMQKSFGKNTKEFV